MATQDYSASGAQKSNLKGILWTILAGLFFVAMTGVVRHLGTDMNSIQAAFMRYVFGALLIVPMLMRLKRNDWVAANYKLHFLRGMFHGVAVLLWFYAMARIPIAEVTALGYIAPIFTTIGAAIFLGEKLHRRRIAAVVIGFLGMLVILRPGIEVIELGAVAQLCAAPLFAFSFLISKKLTDTESSTFIVAALSVLVALVLLPGAIMVWRTPTVEELFWLAMMAFFATMGHLSLTQAFRVAEITAVQPAQFLQLVWATILGLVLFDEQPDFWAWVGAGIIIASATYIAHRESIKTKKEDRLS